MRRKHFLNALLLLTLLFIWAVPTQAASQDRYKTDSNYTTGAVTVTDTKNNTTLAVLGVAFMHVNPDLLVNDDTIYFDAYPRSYSGNEPANYLYKYTISTGEYTLLKELPSGYYGYDVDALYNGSLYITGWNPSSNNRMYRYTLKTGKLKGIEDAAYVKRYKHYIIMDPTKTYGDWNTYPVYVYNTKKDTVKQAAKRAAACALISGKLYIAEVKGSGYVYPSKGLKYTIKTYTIKSGKKKTLKKTVKAYMIQKITKKYIYHQKENYPNPTKYYRTTISSGKRKKISETSYRKAVGY